MVYKFETYCGVSIHHLAALVQKKCKIEKKVFFGTQAMSIFSFSLPQEPLFGKQAERSDVRGTGASHALPNMQVYK